jgi:hypothetical protein
VGGTLNFKNEIPERGFGFTASRNLPFQWATMGFKVRAGIDLYRESEDQVRNNIKSKTKFLSEDYHLALIGTFFLGDFNPYVGFNTGVGHHDINHFDEYIFFIGALTGVKFPLISWVHPYLEISSLKYFSDFDEARTQKDISSLQLKGTMGFLFRFDTIK